jgi:dipeptidyl aminopeptidase/acylaminoacyl peptidase
VAASFPSDSGTNYQSVRWASDGRTLLALTDHGGSDFLRLCRLDPDSGAVAVVYAADGRDVEGWAISSDGTMLATIENDRGYAVLRVGATDAERPVVAGLPRGVISEPAFAPDAKSLAFTVAAPTVPASIWLWHDGTARPLVQPDVEVDPAQFVDLELVEWKSFDGARIPGWLALPPGGKPASGFPAVIWVHGGPVSQTRPNFRPDIQMLLAAGFAVLMPNVRGSSGYGRASIESDDVERRLDSVTDLAHGRHWLAAHPAIDAARIGIMGQSYGGFMVNSAITEHPDLWRAAVSYYGIADFVTLLAGTGAWRRDHRAAEYGDPQRNAELFARISPVHRAECVQVPVLLAHGTRDPRVPYGESEQFAAALAERQKPVTFLSFDYAGHGFIRPADRTRIYAAVVEFFTTHLA